MRNNNSDQVTQAMTGGLRVCLDTCAPVLSRYVFETQLVRLVMKINIAIFLCLFSVSASSEELNVALKDIIRDTKFIGISNNSTTYTTLPRQNLNLPGSKANIYECIVDNTIYFYILEINSVIKGNRNVNKYMLGFSDAGLNQFLTAETLILGSDADIPYKLQEHLFEEKDRITGDCSEYLTTRQIWRAELTILNLFGAKYFSKEISTLPNNLQKRALNEEIIFVPEYVSLPEQFSSENNDLFIRKVQLRGSTFFGRKMKAIYVSELNKYINEFM